MSPESTTLGTALKGFPRVSGDEPTKEYLELSNQVFSPRERG